MLGSSPLISQSVAGREEIPHDGRVADLENGDPSEINQDHWVSVGLELVLSILLRQPFHQLTVWNHDLLFLTQFDKISDFD